MKKRGEKLKKSVDKRGMFWYISKAPAGRGHGSVRLLRKQKKVLDKVLQVW